jgi:hypothetical protein
VSKALHIIGMFMPKLGFAPALVLALVAGFVGPFQQPAPMTRFLGSGLLKRIEAPERDLAVRPEVRGIPEHVQQLLARLAVELAVVGDVLQHHHEARLGPDLLTRSVMQS